MDFLSVLRASLAFCLTDTPTHRFPASDLMVQTETNQLLNSSENPAKVETVKLLDREKDILYMVGIFNHTQRGQSCLGVFSPERQGVQNEQRS